MGLLQKANSIAETRPPTTKGGLLKKTLKILEEEMETSSSNITTVSKAEPTTDNKKEAQAQFVSQDELNELLKATAKRREFIKKNLENWKKHKKVSTVPLTWAEAQREAPKINKEPTLKEEEIEELFNKKKIEGDNRETSDQTTRYAIDVLKKKISEISEGIETPIMIFSILKDHISLKKGAILLYDPLRMVFAPWASVGYDKTTLHRLRIPLAFSESFNKITTGEIIIQKDNLEEYKRFFSNREFNLISQLIFVPFIAKEKLIAILLIQEINLSNNGNDLIDQLKAISPSISEKIFRAREQKLKLLKTFKPEDFDSIRDQINSDLQKARERGTKIFVLLLSLEKIVNYIPQNALTYSDKYRIGEDIEKILKSLLYSSGRVFKLNNFNFLIEIFNLNELDTELLLDQIVHNLNYFITDRSVTFDTRIVEHKLKIFPDEAQTEDELLAGLI